MHIDCVNHPVKIKLVSSSYISKMFKSPAVGLYVSEKNTIFIDKTLSDLEKLHVLGHELKHAFDYQTASLGEEEICDAFGALLIRLVKAKSIKDLCLK